MVKDAILDYEAVLFELQHYEERYKLLESTQVYLKQQLHALSIQITCLKKSEIGYVLNPTPSNSQFDFRTPRIVLGLSTISLSSYAQCLSGFPLKDIIVCRCGHLYHPWCLGIWCRVSSQCVDNSCNAIVHLSWFNSFRFGKLHLEFRFYSVQFVCNTKQFITL